MVNTISKITLYVEDQEKAKQFWTGQMNFVVRLEQQAGPDMKWLEVAPDEQSATVFVLYSKDLMRKQSTETNVGHPSIILSTTDIEKAYEEMNQNGIQTGELLKMPYGSMFHFFDMDGNMYMLRED